MENLYPKRILAIIPENIIKESDDCMVEFKATVQLGKDSSNEMALIITVRDEDNKVLNGVQFISPLVTGGV